MRACPVLTAREACCDSHTHVAIVRPTSLASLGGGGGEFGGAPPPPSASRQPPPLYLADLAELVEVALPYIPDLLEILNSDYHPVRSTPVGTTPRALLCSLVVQPHPRGGWYT